MEQTRIFVEGTPEEAVTHPENAVVRFAAQSRAQFVPLIRALIVGRVIVPGSNNALLNVLICSGFDVTGDKSVLRRKNVAETRLKGAIFPVPLA